ncbi:hypothetical protein LguiA_036525 [Lonicera macranthoides]
MGFRAVIRNKFGNFVAAYRGSLLGCFASFMLKPIGLREVLTWLLREGNRDVIIETDSQLLANAMYSVDTYFSSIGVLISECKTLLSSFTIVR